MDAESGCPKANDFSEGGAYLDARIGWRLKKLEGLRIDAELELGHLSERIKRGC